MQFCPWYPLGDGAHHAPAGEGVLQLRLAHGLVDYPRGKSAMVHYAHALDARAAAIELAARFAGHDLLCRHLENGGDGAVDGEDSLRAGSAAEGRRGAVDFQAIHGKVLGEFVRRFGTAPKLP